MFVFWQLNRVHTSHLMWLMRLMGIWRCWVDFVVRFIFWPG